jgi:hypothetical protein
VTVKLSRVARMTQTRWRWHRLVEAERSGDSTTASARGRHEAQERQRAAPGDSSPPCATPGRLLDSGATLGFELGRVKARGG